MILGFDPGREKCGIAVMAEGHDDESEGFDAEKTEDADPSLELVWSAVVASAEAIATVHRLTSRYPVSTIVMGDQTTSTTWKQTLEQELEIPVFLVDERFSTLEARERYWQIYPPQGLTRLVPQSLRSIPRPIDDVVALILIERYFHTPRPSCTTMSVSSVP